MHCINAKKCLLNCAVNITYTLTFSKHFEHFVCKIAHWRWITIDRYLVLIQVFTRFTNHMHMEIIIQSNNGKICNNGEISAAVKIHAGGDKKQKINK